MVAHLSSKDAIIEVMVAGIDIHFDDFALSPSQRSFGRTTPFFERQHIVLAELVPIDVSVFAHGKDR